ncbi:MAG: hypothetical protein AVDCRST_MAG45-1970, partial [uncultured Solirubrobacterales bacterium]
ARERERYGRADSPLRHPRPARPEGDRRRAHRPARAPEADGARPCRLRSHDARLARGARPRGHGLRGDLRRARGRRPAHPRAPHPPGGARAGHRPDRGDHPREDQGRSDRVERRRRRARPGLRRGLRGAAPHGTGQGLARPPDRARSRPCAPSPRLHPDRGDGLL